MNTSALTAAFAAIEKAGGPAWYDWCDMEDQTIATYDDPQPELNLDTWVYCPPAVKAAVVAYALEVVAWMNRKDEGHNITMWPDDESESWGVDIWIAGEAGPTFSTPNKLAAAEALILAVAGELE
jgi:hypothetical protein